MIDYDNAIINFIFYLFVCLIFFIIGYSFVNSCIDDAKNDIDEYTKLYNECENNYHIEKVNSQICVETGYRFCKEYHETVVDVKVYDVKPNGKTCEYIIASYNNINTWLEFEKKLKKK